MTGAPADLDKVTFDAGVARKDMYLQSKSTFKEETTTAIRPDLDLTAFEEQTVRKIVEAGVKFHKIIVFEGIWKKKAADKDTSEMSGMTKAFKSLTKKIKSLRKFGEYKERSFTLYWNGLMSYGNDGNVDGYMDMFSHVDFLSRNDDGEVVINVKKIKIKGLTKKERGDNNAIWHKLQNEPTNSITMKFDDTTIFDELKQTLDRIRAEQKLKPYIWKYIARHGTWGGKMIYTSEQSEAKRKAEEAEAERKRQEEEEEAEAAF